MPSKAYYAQCSPTPYDIYVDYSFEWDVDRDDDGIDDDDRGVGEPGKDSFAVGWEDELELEEKAFRSSSNVTRPEAIGLSGFSFKYDDAQHINSAPTYDHGYGGWHLKAPDWEEYSNDTTFYGKWSHTYQQMTIKSWSVSPSGIFPSFGNEGKAKASHQIQKDFGEAEKYRTNC